MGTVWLKERYAPTDFQPQRQARLQVMFAKRIEHAVNRERRNDRRRSGRTRG
ncbi:hypothetical protein MKL09_12165 [Methylobacterium sp. J-048]|uniref:hypothetical protein n=1 Tax=Methylobacterium sp. J-048 TaxID=2836635 RepID=UPI001FB8C9E4|nr:hypothetical protein [Methylobacterium sp. J-048]MCJ2057309.1 hypothetical protein [Methylobacterium sp. J-048]